ncbi:hypothetical protein JOQ06_014843, partial [Pogonophryne albipinna]
MMPCLYTCCQGVCQVRSWLVPTGQLHATQQRPAGSCVLNCCQRSMPAGTYTCRHPLD